ncbi:Uncharacterised protein [Mycobacterium tuberculosis]|nr:Uncharacterised protein [Mycobacterium tuberculosis]
MRRLTTTDPGGDCAVADPVQVDDGGAIQNREVHDKPCRAVQFAQQRSGRPHQAILMHGQ